MLNSVLLCDSSQANAIGRSAKTVREYLEKHYTDEIKTNVEECIKLALKALLEVVQSGGKNMELAIMRRNEPLKVSCLRDRIHISVSPRRKEVFLCKVEVVPWGP